MAPKKTRKLVQETVVEEPTQDLDVPLEAIREEEQKGSEDEGDRDNLDDSCASTSRPFVMVTLLYLFPTILQPLNNFFHLSCHNNTSRVISPTNFLIFHQHAHDVPMFFGSRT